VKQVAERLNLSESKCYELIEKGKLGRHRMDGAIRVSEEQIQEYLQRTRREPDGQSLIRRQTGPHLRVMNSRLR